MFKFKTFKTTEEFEDWQKSNEGVNIYQSSPVVMNMGVQHDETDCSAQAQVSVGLFVMYKI